MLQIVYIKISNKGGKKSLLLSMVIKESTGRRRSRWPDYGVCSHYHFGLWPNAVCDKRFKNRINRNEIGTSLIALALVFVVFCIDFSRGSYELLTVER